jgi:serine phosphatase RsbU (regulator of sigma subunit)
MYPEGRCQLAEGDLLLFYTDGIVDLQNAVGKAWGERGFVKSICESAAAGASAEMKLSKLKSNITTYREKSELIDDITLLVCQYGEVA